jgi:hypothetical protein
MDGGSGNPVAPEEQEQNDTRRDYSLRERSQRSVQHFIFAFFHDNGIT